MRRWNFMGGTPYGLAWSGVLCDKHEPWDKGHLKPGGYPPRAVSCGDRQCVRGLDLR